jgi:hypothetical protein
MKRPLLVLTTLFAACPGLLVPECFGALGGTEASVAADQVRLRAARRVLSEAGYTVHEISSGDGTVVREYVSPAGQVFGVSWKGPAIPDLSQLLGSSFAEFKSSIHPAPGRRRAVTVRNSNLVVESAGHARAFFGRAYLTSMLPSGVTQEVVQ